MTETKRPVGLKVAAIALLVCAVVIVCQSIWPIEPMEEELKFGAKPALDPGLALIGFLIAGIWIETAFGLWRRRTWAWWLAIVSNALWVALAVLVNGLLIRDTVTFGHYGKFPGIENLIRAIYPILMHGSILFCLARKPVRRYLNVSTGGLRSLGLRASRL
jgi:hypothetical protein